MINSFLTFVKSLVNKNMRSVESAEMLEKKQTLKQVPLFKGLNERQMRELLPLIREIQVNAGDNVVLENEISDELFVLQKGSAEVIKGATAEEPGHRLSVLQPSACFGELSLLDKAPRSATVRALEPCTLLVLSAEDLNHLAEEKQTAYAILMGNMARHLSKVVRSTDELTVSALKKELAITKQHAAMGKFLIYTLLLWASYNLILGVTSKLAGGTSLTSLISMPLMLFFGLGSFAMMKQSGYPLKFYGLTFDNWKPALIESLNWSVIAIVVMTALKWVLITTVPALQGHTVFEYPESMSVSQAVNTNVTVIMILAFLYIVFVPVQELIFRGAIQSTLQNLLPGDNRVAWAVFISSVLFGMGHLHLSMVALLIAFFPSLMWGVLFARERTLVGVCLSHALLGCWALFVINMQGVLKAFISF